MPAHLRRIIELERNLNIFTKYIQGTDVDILAKEFDLTKKHIYTILTHTRSTLNRFMVTYRPFHMFYGMTTGNYELMHKFKDAIISVIKEFRRTEHYQYNLRKDQEDALKGKKCQLKNR
jgi:hypothetical protein